MLCCAFCFGDAVSATWPSDSPNVLQRGATCVSRPVSSGGTSNSLFLSILKTTKFIKFRNLCWFWTLHSCPWPWALGTWHSVTHPNPTHPGAPPLSPDHSFFPTLISPTILPRNPTLGSHYLSLFSLTSGYKLIELYLIQNHDHPPPASAVFVIVRPSCKSRWWDVLSDWAIFIQLLSHVFSEDFFQSLLAALVLLLTKPLHNITAPS